MIPIEKVQDIIARHDNLEKELSSSSIDTKLFAKKSKEYSNLGNIIFYAREFLKFETEKKDLSEVKNKLESEFTDELKKAFSIKDKQERSNLISEITDKAKKLYEEDEN